MTTHGEGMVPSSVATRSQSFVLKGRRLREVRGMLKVPMTLFFPEIFSLPYVQTNSNRRKIPKNLKLGFFRALKCSYFVVKVPRELVTN